MIKTLVGFLKNEQGLRFTCEREFQRRLMSDAENIDNLELQLAADNNDSLKSPLKAQYLLSRERMNGLSRGVSGEKLSAYSKGSGKRCITPTKKTGGHLTNTCKESENLNFSTSQTSKLNSNLTSIGPAFAERNSRQVTPRSTYHGAGANMQTLSPSTVLNCASHETGQQKLTSLCSNSNDPYTLNSTNKPQPRETMGNTNDKENRRYRKSTGMSVINSLNWCINKQKNSSSNGGDGSNSNMTNTNTNTANLESEGFLTTEGRGPRSDA